MKKIISIIASVLAVVSLSSCEDFLTEVPQSTLVPENSFTSADDWNKALTAAYSMLQEIYIQSYTIMLNEFGTDEVINFDGWSAYTELCRYTFSATHEFLRCHYIWCYDGIKRCNTLLDMPDSAPVSKEDRALIQAQAKFLRALFYFDLVASYGGVPMWTSAVVDKDQISKPRSSADEVYSLIVKDMTEAAEALPEKWTNQSDKGRATSGAANAMLGRFYLQWGKSSEALEALNKVIGKYKLYDNYADIFDKHNKNMEVENIFEVQTLHSGYWDLEGSIQSSYWGPRGGGGPTAGGFGWGGFGPTQYLYDSYDSDDLRKTAFFCTEYLGVPQNPPCIMKYRDGDYDTEIEDDDLNYIAMRYADVLLMKSEALNNLGDTSNDKYDCLNQVRKRAGIKLITASDNLSKEAFADVLLEERLHELCCEHHRRFDLIRFGKLAEQVRAAFPDVEVKPYHYLYPIPQQAIDANDNMSQDDQNPGY